MIHFYPIKKYFRTPLHIFDAQMCNKNTKKDISSPLIPTQTETIIEVEEKEEQSITQRIDQEIDETACKLRFQEFTEKRNTRIYNKIIFNIRNYVVLTQKEINETRLLDDKQKMDIILLFNTAIKHLIQLI